MNKETVLEIAFKGAVDNFSDNYVNSMENKDSFTIHDIQEAFKAGAKWAKDFISVADITAPRL